MDNIADLILRSTTQAPFTTKGSALDHTDFDANMILIGNNIIALNNATLISAWSIATAYTSGQYVLYSSALWKAVASSTGVTPGTDDTKWNLSSIGELAHERNKDTEMYVPSGSGLSEATIDSRAIWHAIQAGFKYKKKSLTKSEVQGLYTTPITVVDAPGAGKAIVPVRCWVRYNYDTAPHNSVPFGLAHDTANTFILYSLAVLESTITRILNLVPMDVGTPAASSSQILENKAIQAIASAGSVGTTGQGTIDIYCIYSEITL